MIIRAAEIEDIKQIKAIDQLLFEDESYPIFALRQLHDITNGLMKVAELDKEIVAYGIGHYNNEKQEAWFLSLGVLPCYRGRKIGERLTSDMVEDVKAMGASSIYLTVHPENEHGINIYEKLGFETQQAAENYYLDHSPRLVMVKNLN
ncbi:N-acetyltransferase [Pontibacter diazotrophicus]|uniref:N-acetyltransferase n=1 Tax=Pontibacter diazotrophicus TaxID=1400979 RepID=A0A3D8LBP6_9BACT|nr:N-acetyltransferase [Pontibacter diazotrophicus]RDV14828.1 N-acetyltransferase [Pontibacter diazotrophicus]